MSNSQTNPLVLLVDRISSLQKQGRLLKLTEQRKFNEIETFSTKN